jgi:predicted dehydrogenase
VSEALRVGLVGCGRWGRNILRDLRTLGCRVETADPDPEACRKALAGGAAVAVDHVDKLSHPCDAYVIAAWTSRHGQIIDRLLGTGRPIFCEKPLTNDTDHARRIAATAGNRVFVMHKWRYHPGVEKLAELVRSGEYGRVRQVSTRRLQWTTPHGDVDAIWTLTPHDLSMIYGILGFMPEPRAAAGTADGDGKGRSLFAILGNAEPTATLHVAANWPRVERVVSVAFEHGVAVLDDPLADHIKAYPGRGGQAYASAPAEERVLPVSTEFPLLRELRVFLDHVRGGPPPPTDAREGALIVETLARLRALAGLG